MSDHEQLHEDLAADADRLEGQNEHLDEAIDDARDARDRAAADDFIAIEPSDDSTASGHQPIGDLTDVGDSQDDDGPPPEITYTSKE
jgi:hypothetical protein